MSQTRTAAGPPRALTALGVRAGEAPLVGWVTALFFVIQASHGVGLNGADALFFLRFGVEHLPLMILASGCLVMLGILGYAAGLSWRGSRAWLWPVPFVGAALVGVERVGIALEVPGIYAVVWLTAQVVMMVTFTLMWNAAGEVCTTRQAKRLFPLFASAGIAGGVLGNALTGPAASVFGTENLLLVQAGLLVLGGLLTLGTSRRFFQKEDVGVSPSPLKDLAAGMRATWNMQLLRLVAAVTAAFSILFYLVVFPFSEIVAASFDTEADVAGYLGVFSSLATATTFLVSLLVARALFTRLGVVATLMIVPIVYASGFLLWLGSFTLLTASVVRGAQWIAINAIGGTATSSLFNVIRGRRRAQVMAFVVAVPAQFGTVMSGAILLLAGDLSDRTRFLVSLGVAAVAGLIVVRMRRAYRTALVSAVESGIVEVFTAPTTAVSAPDLDADALHAVEQALRDDRAGRRRAATVILGQVGGKRSAALITEGLDDADPTVRLAALDALGSADAAATVLADPDPSVRLRAIEIIGRSSGGVAKAEHLLADSHPRVRAAAAALVGGEPARRAVTELLASGEPGSVIAGLEAVAAGVDAGTIDIASLADHPDREVRRTVATALTGGAHDPILERLLDDVSPAVREAAGEALAVHRAGRERLLEVLRNGSVRASESALSSLVDAGAHPELRQWIDSEIGRAALLRRWAASLQGDGSDARQYLVSVLRSRQRRLERWAIRAMEADDASLSAVRRGAWSKDVETRSQALEALESIADRPRARRLVTLIEADAAAALEPREAYREMAIDFDPWIRALALRAFSEENVGDPEGIGEGAAAASAEKREPAPFIASVQPAGTGVLDRMLTMQRVPMFSLLDPEELHLVARAATEADHGAGEVVFRGGEAGDAMLIITDGSVEVRTGASLVAVRRAGEFVGELSILRGKTRMADVVAGDSGVSGLMLEAEALRGLVAERPKAALAMLSTLAGRLAELLPGENPPDHAGH